MIATNRHMGDLLTSQRRPPPHISDGYADLLEPLSERQRRAITLQLTIGFYEGWRPSRAEIAELVAAELGVITVDELLDAQRRRNRGQPVPDLSQYLLTCRSRCIRR